MQLLLKSKTYWQQYPLRSLLIIALILRLLAAIFSQGYGMHDDHFVVIEEPWSWTQGEDYDGWLPGEYNTTPSIFSFFYPGINYVLFKSMDALGLSNPKGQMFIIRLLLGLFSLLTVYFGYKITAKLSNEKYAREVGLLLTLLWFMPFMGVRNLVEVVATPLLFAGTWLVLKHEGEQPSWKKQAWCFLAGGLLVGIAISIRFQTIIYLGGMGLALLFQKRIAQAFVFGLGALLSLALIQGIPDYFIWGKPFVVLRGYIEYNLQNKGTYGNQENYLMYVELIPGLLLPPLGALWFFGFFRKAKKHLIVFLPVILFILFHTYFPNRQERFILTVVPMVVLLGVIGWNSFYENSRWWLKHQKLRKGFYTFFWILNTLLLLVLTFTYTKKSRVEAMYYFSQKASEADYILVEHTGRARHVFMPVYYAGRPIKTVNVGPIDTTVMPVLKEGTYFHFPENFKILENQPAANLPDYVVFVEDEKLEQRVEQMKNYFPALSFEAYIEPSFIDKVMKKMNPNNRNEDFYIYSTGVKE